MHQLTVDNAFSGRDQLSAYFKDRFPERLQKLLDEQFDPAQTVYIDALKINIKLNRRHDTSHIDEEILSQIRTALVNVKANALHSVKEKNIYLNEHSGQHAFFYFLETGCLPWWYQPDSIETFQQSILEEIDKAEEAGKQNFIAQLIHLFQHDACLSRCILQFNDTFKIALLSMVVDKPKQEIISSMSQIKKSLQANNKNVNPQIEVSTNAVIRELIKKSEVSKAGAADHVSGITNSNKSVQPDKNRLVINGKEGLFINNAGIILLHPFVDTLFTVLNYKFDDRNDLKEKNKAITALCYLAGHDEQVPEYHLALFKILCGVELETPVHPGKLLIQEKEECDSLLQQVCGYWTALKNASPQALQETFIRRDGKLMHDTQGWLLQVEQKTVDILMDKLPWGFSMIKLPWMKEILSVEWQ